jgi:hypothetical protein
MGRQHNHPNVAKLPKTERSLPTRIKKATFQSKGWKSVLDTGCACRFACGPARQQPCSI